MRTPKQSGLFDVASTLDRLRDHIGRQLEAAAEYPRSGPSQNGAEEQAILQAIPELIFRIRRNGSVSIMGNGSYGYMAAKSEGQPSKKVESWDPAKSLSEELARQSKDLVTKAVQTGQVQVLDIQLHHNGQTTYYEVRAAVCNRTEVLAVVRDVTARRETEIALRKSRDELEVKAEERAAELDKLKEAFQNQVTLLAEEEDILKKSFGNMERLLEDTIGAITLIVQKKDPYTAGHQQRVSQLACAIGQEMGLRDDRIRVIRIASHLHDLGKVFIPSEILAKPGKLSEVEFSMVKTHPDADYQILKTIDFSCAIADIVHQHHERLDGSGYPLGLKGDDILLEARIIAVADVIEAMVSTRPYRPAPGMDVAMNEIASGRGTLYDPSAVDACIKLFNEGRFHFE